MGLGDRRIPDADAFKKGFRLGLEAIRRGSFPGARESLGRRQVEQEGQVGTQGTLDVVFEHRNAFRIDPTATTLVGIGGIRKAVAQHPGPMRQGRPDLPRDVLGASGEEEQHLGIGRHALPGGVEQQLTDALADGRAAGLPRGEDTDPPCLQTAPDDGKLSGLARPFDALQGDESAFSFHGSVACLPTETFAANTSILPYTQPAYNRLVPVDNSLIFINFMNRLRAKRTDSLTNRFFLLSIRPV